MRIREMQLDDHPAVMQVHQRNGLAWISRDDWVHFNRDIPFDWPGERLPIGWVLENDAGEMVGVYGNLHGLCSWRGKTIRTAVSQSWAVDTEYRRSSLLLLAKYLGQRNVDLLLNTSANAESARVQDTLKVTRLPMKDFDQILMWILDYPALVNTYLQLNNLQKARLFSPILAGMLCGTDFMLRRSRVWRNAVPVEMIDDFDERFDAFWERLAKQSTQLLSQRDCRTLRWHFHQALRKKSIKIFTAASRSEMQGYLILWQPPDLDISIPLQRHRVADLQVLDDQETVLHALFAAAHDYAKKQGSQVIEVVGMNAFKRKSLESLRPHVRQASTFNYYYHAVSGIDDGLWQSPDAWDPTPFDGDNSLWA